MNRRAFLSLGAAAAVAPALPAAPRMPIPGINWPGTLPHGILVGDMITFAGTSLTQGRLSGTFMVTGSAEGRSDVA